MKLEGRNDFAANVGSWLQVLRNDKRVIFAVAAHAQRAVACLHGLQAGADTVAAIPAFVIAMAVMAVAIITMIVTTTIVVAMAVMLVLMMITVIESGV